MPEAQSAGMQDYWRGGTEHSPADRAAAEHAMAAYPGLAASVRANRAFLGRSVRFLAGEVGLRQFLDVGTGVLAEGGVHEVAPGRVVVYCDNDPAVVARGREVLGGEPRYIEADLRKPTVLLNRAAQAGLDVAQPVAVTLVSVLHLVRPATPRDYEAVGRFFENLELVPPGLVRVPLWRPDSEQEAASPSTQWGVVASKPN